MRFGYAIAVGGAAMLALAFSLLVPAPAPAPVVAAGIVGDEPELDFDHVWRDAAVPAAMKSALLFGFFKSVMATRIPPPDPEAGVPTVVLATTRVPDAKPRRHATNVCERHGMKKIRHGRYGWRCRKR